MATFFRRRITKKVMSTLKPFLKGEEKLSMYDSLPLSLKLTQPKLLPPQFELAWKDVVKLQPDLKDRIHPTTFLTYLKNQNFPTPEGITDILKDAVSEDKLIFTIDQESFSSSVLLHICKSIEKFPSHSTYFKSITPEDIIVEYSSPNVAKPFHFGHFRSTIMGNFIANICEYVDHKVTRLNYIGDWGLQYGILALGFSKFGCREKLQKDPLNHLFEVYKEANEQNTNDPVFNEEAKMYFKKMEEGDADVLSLWNELRDLSLREMNNTYKRLNIQFDETHGESMYAKKVEDIYDMLLNKGLAYRQDDGSIDTITSDEKGVNDTTILRKSDGTSLYLTRDLAAAVDRHKKFHFDSLYYVVDSSQQKHFRILTSILKSLEYPWASDLHHVPFGRILQFSTRKGTAVFLHDILNESQERTLENMKNSPTTKVTEDMESVADLLGIASLIVNDFGARRKRDYPFDWEKVLTMKGNSGISLQYCHARLNNIKENCGVNLCLTEELASLSEPEALSLIHQLARFDEVIYQAYTDLEPCLLVHYLFVLRTEINRAIKVLTVKGSSPYVARARLLLFHSAYLVMNRSLKLLGITPLNEM